MITLFLATVIGWYFVIGGLFTLLRQDQLRMIVAELSAQRALFFIVAIITVILGLLMVASHNIWVLGLPLIITLICWLVLISGIVRLFFADKAIQMAQSMMDSPKKMKIAGIITMIIGILLLIPAYYYGLPPKVIYLG